MLAHRIRPKKKLQEAIRRFDRALPDLKVMRDVSEHFGDYALDSGTRHHPEVTRGQLQAGEWDGRTFLWLENRANQPRSLDVVEALNVSRNLFEAVRESCRPESAGSRS